MAIQTETEPEAGVGPLIGGIVQDARQLLVEQLTLFQVEIKNDVHRTLRALLPIGAGAVVALPGLILLGMAGSYLLCWAWPQLPLWAGFAIIGGLIAVIGASLVFWGISMLNKVHLTPDTAMKGLRENIQWKTKT